MKKLHIIMPMGGEGSRFKNIGINTPKPLILANEELFFVRAVNSLLLEIPHDNIKLTCIVRKEHIDNYHIDEEIKKIFPFANVLYVEQTTRGTVETCMLANIEDNESVVVLDCDLEYKAIDYINHIKAALNNENNESALISFYSDKTKYSYALTDNDNYVIETAEKIIISHNALIGSYFFNSGKLFKEAANYLISDRTHIYKELYTSLLYNYLIEKGHKIKLYKADKYYSFGTPEELNIYEQIHKNDNF